jgi:asparagine N-glycosylation enzyme membrane subunit Stt3
MYQPTLFRDRPRPVQIVLGGVIPAIAGAVAGVLIGVSSGAYWGYAAFVAIASVGAGFEHLDGWGGADRGLIAGAVYGVGLLLAHLIAGTHAKVSLGSFPPFLVVITALAGMLLSALGGYLARVLRERERARATVPVE